MLRENLASSNGKVEKYIEPEFQNWLVSRGFIRVSNEEIDGLEFRIPFMYGPAQAIIAEVLGNNLKRIVSTARLTRAIYNGQDDPLHIKYARADVTRFRKRMVRPELIMVLNGIGYGLGVVKCTLFPQDIVLMHYFWQHEDQWSPIPSIAKATAMSEDAIVCRIMTWRRKEDYGRTFAVCSQHSSGKGYMFSTNSEGIMEA